MVIKSDVPKKSARKTQACQYRTVPAGRKAKHPLPCPGRQDRARLLGAASSSRNLLHLVFNQSFFLLLFWLFWDAGICRYDSPRLPRQSPSLRLIFFELREFGVEVTHGCAFDVKIWSRG